MFLFPVLVNSKRQKEKTMINLILSELRRSLAHFKHFAPSECNGAANAVIM